MVSGGIVVLFSCRWCVKENCTRKGRGDILGLYEQELIGSIIIILDKVFGISYKLICILYKEKKKYMMGWFTDMRNW